ncbi:MAG: hypothetical protein ACK449_07225 [Planctomycetota bacterium]
MHLPYYRLQDLFASSGWTPSRSSLDCLTDTAVLQAARRRVRAELRHGK